MKPQKGYYSIVQYCPDLSRLEAANIGVLLFCPESGFLKVLTSANNGRIIRFFGSAGHDWKRINTIKSGLQDRLDKEGIRTVDELQHFVATRANSLQLTPPLPVKVQDPEKDLRELFREIVREPDKRTQKTSLKKLLREKFDQAGLENKVIANVTVDVPVTGQEIEIPFGFQNGRFNLISPVRFGAADPQQSFRTACRFAVEGRSIYDHADKELGNLQLVVVGQFRPNDDLSPKLVRRVFAESAVKL
ncbi:MAG: DUF3037 domain-containing protein, partial [Planctomyces sp.]